MVFFATIPRVVKSIPLKAPKGGFGAIGRHTRRGSGSLNQSRGLFMVCLSRSPSSALLPFLFLGRVEPY